MRSMPLTLEVINRALHEAVQEGRSGEVVNVSARILIDGSRGLFMRFTMSMADGCTMSFDTSENIREFISEVMDSPGLGRVH